MTAKRVTAQQHDIHRQDERANTEAELLFTRGNISKPHGLPDVPGEKDNKQKRHVKKITMNILHDERKGFFAEVPFPRFSYGTCRRVGPERFVVCAAIIIASKAKASRRPENEQSRGKRQPTRPPTRFGTEPTMGRIAKEPRGIKRRDIRSIKVMLALQRSPGGIHDKGGKHDEDQERLCPPGIRAHGSTKRGLFDRCFSVRHRPIVLL